MKLKTSEFTKMKDSGNVTFVLYQFWISVSLSLFIVTASAISLSYLSKPPEIVRKS